MVLSRPLTEGFGRGVIEMKWISATVDKEYSDDEDIGIDGLNRGDNVCLNADGTWNKL